MLFDGCHKISDMSPYWYFCQLMPALHIDRMVDLTNAQMIKASFKVEDHISDNKLIQFFGIILLIPYLPDHPCCQLWNNKPCTKYSCCGNLGKTRTTCHCFKDILRHIWYVYELFFN